LRTSNGGMEIKLKSFGFAKNQEKKHVGGWGEVVTDLVIEKQYQDALLGLDDYSHLIVIYWMHEVNIQEMRHVPQGKVGVVPEVGIFACRCPQHPNPIGVSTVRVLGIEDNIITVEGLDIINDTPILDIKPYTPQYDVVDSVKVPDWVNRLDY